ncbi:MAG: hypothetical protein AAF638_02415 [Pseudomonadota bacterium]
MRMVTLEFEGIGTVFRIALMAVATYAYGAPSFDGMRPAALDRPLKELYRDVGSQARDGMRSLQFLSDARAMPALQVYMREMQALRKRR